MDDIPLSPQTPKGGKPSLDALRGELNQPAPTSHDSRRGFVTKAAAVVVGGAITACPVAAGLAVLADPLRRQAGAVQLIRVAALEALPDDGLPRQFQVVVAHRDDAWNRFHNEPVGAVFLRREKGSDKVQAFNASCPHAGCFVSFNAQRRQYQCPCHTSAFDVDGRAVFGPSPRALDELACEVRADSGTKEIYVAFQDFYTGIAEKKAKA